MSLIERLEAAEVGDDTLDELVLMETTHPYGFDLDDDPPPVTTSLDAALALAERVLPGWEFGTYINRPDINGNRFTKIEAHRWQDVAPEHAFACASSSASTPALALCIAILKSKETK